MSENNIELARLWLKKADNDLITAKQTFLLPDGPTDTVCFHSQQVVEKSLKALLTLNQIQIPKIHDLVRLLELALPYLSELEGFREDFAEMSNYAVAVRYPDDWFEPGREDTQHSLDVAEQVIIKIKGLIYPV